MADNYVLAVNTKASFTDRRSDVLLREATADDAEAIAGLCFQLGYLASAADVRSRLAFVAGADRALTVACEAGRVGAWVEVQVQSTIGSGSWAEIAGLVVDQTVRRRSVGASGSVAHSGGTAG